MARIRSLKPEFWDDRKLARSTTRDARMLYMGLWNQADEHGRLNGDEFWIKGRVFPYDDDITTDDIGSMLTELETAGRLERYDVDGDPFLYLPKLAKHQRLEPAKVDSRLPAPPARTDSNADANQSEPRADSSERDAESSTLLYGSGSMDQGAGSRVAPRGARLTEDWTPDDELRRWTLEQLTSEQAQRELEKFRNHWLAKTGKDATKLDWGKTWRNWVLNAQERRRAGPGESTTDRRVNDARTLAAELRAQESTERAITA